VTWEEYEGRGGREGGKAVLEAMGARQGRIEEEEV